MQGVDAESVSLELAVDLLAAKAEKVQNKTAKAGSAVVGSGKSSTSRKSGTAVGEAKGGRAGGNSTVRKTAKHDGAIEPTKDAKCRKGRKARSRAAGADGVVQTATTDKAAPVAAVVAARKRGLNPYMQWKQQRWPSLKAEHPDMSFKELMSLTSEEWSNLDPAVKQGFEKDASKQRTRTPQAVSS